MATYKRSIFIVDPKFQYKFCFYVCSLAFLSSMIYPLTIADVYDKVVALQPHNPNTQTDKENLLMALFITQMAILGLIFLVTIFVSHKIAGPMYKLKTYLEDLRTGQYKGPLVFRDGDNFTDVAIELNKYVEHVQATRSSDFKYLEEVSQYISNLSLVLPEDKKPVLNEALSKLAEIRSRETT